MKPTSYEDWKNCITVKCGIPLTPDFVKKRLIELNDPSNYGTKKFLKTWGEDYHQTVIAWFERAEGDSQTVES